MSARKGDRVARDLLRRIVAGEVAVGEILPKEAELAERYGVNRSVVREAIKQLEVHGLLRPVRRRGTEVLDPLRSMSPEVLSAMLRPTEEAPFDGAVLADLLELRAELDQMMAALAAERRTADDVRAMRAVFAEIAASLGDGPRYGRLMSDLSLVIAKAAKNRLLEALVHWNAAIYDEHEALFAGVRQATPPHLQGTSALIDLIEAGDADAARRLVAAFHEWATPRLLAAALLMSGGLPGAEQESS
jgi:DNA-binding FadR family transcriptional regulator